MTYDDWWKPTSMRLKDVWLILAGIIAGDLAMVLWVLCIARATMSSCLGYRCNVRLTYLIQLHGNFY